MEKLNPRAKKSHTRMFQKRSRILLTSILTARHWKGTQRMTRRSQSKKQIAAPRRDSKYFLNEEDDLTATPLREYQIMSIQKHLAWVVQYVQRYSEQQPDRESRLSCADIAVVTLFA